MVWLLVLLGIIGLFTLAGTWLVFLKAGKPGWASIIPIYSTWIILEIGGKPGWWSLIMLIPVLNIVALVVYIIALIEIAKRFTRNVVFGIFGLFLFSFVGWPILGFGKKYQYNHSNKSSNEVNPPTPTIPVDYTQYQQ